MASEGIEDVIGIPVEFDEIGTIRFTKSDIVRNPLIERIEEVFDNNPY